MNGISLENMVRMESGVSAGKWIVKLVYHWSIFWAGKVHKFLGPQGASFRCLWR